MSLLLKKFLVIGAASLLGSASPSRAVLWSCDRIAESRAQYPLETHNGREKLVSLFDKESASRWSLISGINFLGFPLAGGGTRQVASFSQPVISPQLPSAEGAQKES